MSVYLTMILRTATLLFLLPFSISIMAEVEGNCELCHKFPGIGRYTQTESDPAKDPAHREKFILYIDDELYDASYHGKIHCKGCHIGVDKIPHTDVPKVDCATDCHIRDPSVDKAFSHKKIVDDFRKSVHGVDGSRSEDKSGLPVCKDCHTNKTYHIDIEARVGTEDFLKVCNECHQSEAWTKRFFEHMLYRSLKRRTSREVIKLCSRCHMDAELMAKHNLDYVAGFKETFHAKAISYGDEDVANCLNCHAPYQLGFSPHRIKSARDESSPTHSENKIETCRQAGCHMKAQLKFGAGSRVHPSPGKIQLVGRTTTTKTTTASREAEKKLLADTLFEAKVIGWIILFYKVLIACVISGFILHRSLDIYAARREKRIMRSLMK
ncbi:MAG: hypothetical protein A2W28_00610 [Gammaproteobacteria bacterium RBG_16_51_14]|nr:MAG: hypothetical protein A2W28_00610 [Gammaproteobacteria bacterium RBG_16_51_14]